MRFSKVKKMDLKIIKKKTGAISTTPTSIIIVNNFSEVCVL